MQHFHWQQIPNARKNHCMWPLAAVLLAFMAASNRPWKSGIHDHHWLNELQATPRKLHILFGPFELFLGRKEQSSGNFITNNIVP